MARILERAARLGWRLRFNDIMLLRRGFAVTCSMTPVFPGCSALLAERGIAWDLRALLASIERPGGRPILNSECGYPPDAYLNDHVLVSHPSPDRVAWDLDTRALAPALEADLVQGWDGLRLVFSRPEYERDIQAMLGEARAAMQRGVLLTELTQTHWVKMIKVHLPDTVHLPIYEFEPPLPDIRDEEGC